MSCACPPQGGFQGFEDVMRHLDGLGLFHMDLGLGRMERALAALGLTRLPCPVVQVVGTNGKGSTSTFLHALAMAHGFRAGLFTSPHFVSPEERIRMGRMQLPRRVWASLASQVYAAAPELTYFEFLTVMAALAFADAEPDLLIFEAGLGGRSDATTALHRDMVVFTPIDLDHQNILGPDLLAIAADKADALGPAVTLAVSAPQPPEAAAVLAAKAHSLGIPLVHASEEALAALAESTPLGLMGAHQRQNARAALTAWLALSRHQGWPVDERCIAKGLASAFLPGRMQRADVTPHGAFLLDGAHNAHGLGALTRALEDGNIRPSAMIFSCLGDKNLDAMLPLVRRIMASLAPKAPVLIPTISDNSRAAPGEELAARLGAPARAVPNLVQALQALPPHREGPALICGSLYLLSEFYHLFPECLN